MTKKQFLKKLSETRPGKWRVEHGQAIRTEDGQCPIEAVAGVPPGRLSEAIQALDLGPIISGDIVHGADWAEYMLKGVKLGAKPLALRLEMLKTLGLEEKQ